MSAGFLPRPGDPVRLGDYRLVHVLGEGGQGTVYLAESPGGDQVAVKLLHTRLAADPVGRERFLREVRAARSVAEFCTARILDVGVHENRPFVVSEYIEGPSLYRLIVNEGPRVGGALERLAIGMLVALTAIHRAGIVHRDFKPQNVLMGPDGPRVVDFGIARLTDMITVTAEPLGTPNYIAPEQLRNLRVGPAVDVFCWAATVSFAANGFPPFGGDSVAAVLHRVLHAEPDLGSLSGPLRPLVEVCLSKDPARRPGAHELLSTLLGHPGIADPPESASDLFRDRFSTVPREPMDHSPGRWQEAASPLDGARSPQPDHEPTLDLPPVTQRAADAAGPTEPRTRTSPLPDRPGEHPAPPGGGRRWRRMLTPWIIVPLVFVIALPLLWFAAERTRAKGPVVDVALPSLAGQQIRVAGKLLETDAGNFREVVKVFERRTGATVNYTIIDGDSDDYINPRIKQGQLPDIVIAFQSGRLRNYAAQGALTPLPEEIKEVVERNYSPYWRSLGSINGTLYSVAIKVSNKSVFWYNREAFTRAGVSPPGSWTELVRRTAPALSRQKGISAISVCGQSGWTLTDWFENIYLSQSGPQRYDQLARREIPWTDPSVTRALNTLAELWRNSSLISRQSAQTAYPGCLKDVFERKTAAMAYSTSFARIEIPTPDRPFFAFPAVEGGSRPVIFGGHWAVACNGDSKTIALMKWLASGAAGREWAKTSNYISVNKAVRLEDYADAEERQIARLTEAGNGSGRFDISDMSLPQFGANEAAGAWPILRSFLQNPAKVQDIQKQLESAAADAYGD